MNELEINSQEVIDAENKLFSAQRVSDVELLDALLDDELLAVSPSGEIVTKEMDLEMHRSKTMVIQEASTTIDEIKIASSTALTVVTMTVKGTVAGTPVAGRFRYFRVWKYSAGTLKVIGASFMQLPEDS